MKALAVGPWQASIITAGRNVTIVMPWRTRHRGPVILYIDRWPQQQPSIAVAKLTDIKRIRGFADIPDDQS